MRAIRIHSTGGPDVLQLDDVPTPAPGAGQVLIAVVAAGVNYADLGMRQGVFHQAPRLPATLGFEVTGIVAALGAGVAEFAVGQRVGAVLDEGGYADYAVADVARTISIPDDLDFARVAALLIQGPTAYGVLYDAGRFQPGDAVLVQAAAGGVGSLAVQLARLGGASVVVGTAGSAEKCSLVRRLGADVVVDYTQPDWIGQVRGATHGRGVDLVLESVGGDIGMQAYGALAPLGRLVIFGSTGGRPAMPDPMLMNVMGLTVAGFGGPWLRPGRAQAARAAISRYLHDGEMEIVPGPIFPLAGAADAHRTLASRGTTGKVVLRVRDDAGAETV